MSNLPSQYILTIKPKEYLQQGPSHCGVYSIKGILSAYGKDIKGHPKEYHPYKIGRLTGMTFGGGYYVQILKTYGVKSEIKTAENLSDSDKLILIKKLLFANTPVMIRIGNGLGYLWALRIICISR